MFKVYVPSAFINENYDLALHGVNEVLVNGKLVEVEEKTVLAKLKLSKIIELFYLNVDVRFKDREDVIKLHELIFKLFEKDNILTLDEITHCKATVEYLQINYSNRLKMYYADKEKGFMVSLTGEKIDFRKMELPVLPKVNPKIKLI